jgi:hypothetical protein
MKTIWKFPLEVGLTHLAMPLRSEIIHLAVQDGQPCLWAVVEPDAPRVTRSFVTAGTGHPVGQEIGLGNHVGTYLLLDGRFVGHVFEIDPPPA